MCFLTEWNGITNAFQDWFGFKVENYDKEALQDEIYLQ